MNRKEQISLLIAICNQLEANQVLIEKISKLVDEHVPTEHSLAGKKMPVFITIADYAREHDIIVKDYPWDAPVTRADFAEILVNALMDSTIPPINTIEDGTIPDVPADHEQASSIYKLYRAGVLTGSNAEGRFYPDTTIQRCEVAAVLTRIIDETVRKDMTMVFSREPKERVLRTASVRDGVKIPVLLYHGVSNWVWGFDYLFVSPNNMRRQLQWLKDNGYETIFFSDLTHLSDYQKPILLTFDDGYDGNYTNLFPMLQEYNMKATIFVVSDEIGNEHRMDKYQLREMSDSGLVSIQSHTKSHGKHVIISILKNFKNPV